MYKQIENWITLDYINENIEEAVTQFKRFSLEIKS